MLFFVRFRPVSDWKVTEQTEHSQQSLNPDSLVTSLHWPSDV
ncbi:hypothetical protein SynTAK9802_00828 [Synechococcus sp. TAK9802]|nr:hypothetical protein SynTAK9802_00828 [Synechococcus sp. TAK9802]